MKKIVKYIFILTHLLVSGLPLAAQDNTLTYNLSMLDIHLTGLANLLPIRLEEIARRMVFILEIQHPINIQHIITRDKKRFIVQNITVTTEPQKDFITSLRKIDEVNGLLSRVFAAKIQVPFTTINVSFSELEDSQTISVLYQLITDILKRPAFKGISKDQLETMAGIPKEEPRTAKEEKEFTFLNTKIELLTVSEIVFLQLYFLGILAATRDVQVNTLENALNASKIVSTIVNTKEIASALKNTITTSKEASNDLSQTQKDSLTKEYQSIKSRLTSVANDYVISKLPKDNQPLQEFGQRLLNKLEREVKQW